VKRMTLLVASAFLCLGNTAWGQPADCPWRLATGHWQLLVVSSLVMTQAEEPVSHYDQLKGLESYVGKWIGKGAGVQRG